MISDTVQIDKELVEWIDGIPFSRPARNLTRDFSDAGLDAESLCPSIVLTAEVLKLYYPRHVELHNYVPVNSVNTKRENWKMLNRKVLVKLDMKLSSDAIHQLANGSQGAIERLLTKLRMKVLKDGVEAHRPKLKEGEKIGDNSADNDSYLKSLVESSNEPDIDNETREIKPSKFTCLKQGALFVFSWIICLFRIWNIFSYCIHPRYRRRDALVDVTTERIEDADHESAKRTIYAELKQELQEKEEVISTLNHKIAYLESSMKLKDLRISSLAAQILQNAVEMDQSATSQSVDGVRAKLRSRSHNFNETKAN
ncbi:PREDICTED: sperm flagellar protein 1-like [Vollenhovia emeryi]|uniref:sperm flagellar protein 1-like n=1 Tax=Vollenhovia emeryi TaxID=411798 RepID=UPI0005F37032|nr:PREDICTED: sperm flagellar protein 1-like [Vollenhovia emeryi]